MNKDLLLRILLGAVLVGVLITIIAGELLRAGR